MKISEAVAQRIKGLLFKKKITQYRLERNMAIPHNTMITLMNAKHDSVNLKTIILIAKGFDMTLNEFFNDPIFNYNNLIFD